MSDQEQQATPATTPPAPVPETKTEPEADPREAQIKAMEEKLSKYEADQAKQEQAKLSEAEKVQAERQRLNAERFTFGLERAGIPEGLRSRFAAPEKDHDTVASDIGKAWTKAVAAAVKAEMEKSKASGTQDVGRPAGSFATDQGRVPGRPTATMKSPTARPSALKAK